MISEGFQTIIRGWALRDADYRAIANHLSSIRTRLQDHLALHKTLVFGSYERGSAIRKSSDVDLLVVLRRREVFRGGDPIRSTTILNRVRSELGARFRTTLLGRDKHAIVVRFADGRSVDVVPAWWVEARPQDGWPVYAIPDGNGNWMSASPDRHGRYVADADDRSGGKLKHVARILKYWRSCRKSRTEISSLYAELLMAQTDICRPGRSYAQCFAELLGALVEIQCRMIRDPVGVSEGIEACGTELKRRRAVGALVIAHERALDAIEEEGRGRLDRAAERWDIAFNRGFLGGPRRRQTRR